MTSKVGRPPVSGSALADVAYLRIREMVLRRQLRPGERTSVARLAEAIGIGRSPVKEAVTRLSSEGLLEVSDRRGTSAVRLTMAEVDDLFELRKLFESYAASRAVERITDAELTELDELLKVLEDESITKPLAQQSVTRFIDADVKLHAMIVRAAGNAQLSRYYEMLNLHLQIADYLFRHHAGMREDRHRDHVAIVDALRRRDGTALATLLRSHSESVQHTILAAMRSEEADRAWPGGTDRGR